MVVATQNPVEMDGTYPLPEAQLDRFLMLTSVGAPSREIEVQILRNRSDGHGADMLSPVATVADVQSMIDSARQVYLSDALLGLSLIHISEPTRLLSISYAVFCLKKKTKNNHKTYITHVNDNTYQ